MFSEKIEAQDFAVRILKAHLKENRLAHTYLLSGEEHAGKEHIAAAFACALNCEKGAFFGECECTACRKTAQNSHPDVKWLGTDADVRSIKIEEIRDVISSAYLKPYEGKWKVFILQRAERLTTDASNALLKTLEEPPPQTIFILLVESKMHLLETIQSRSFEIRLRPLGDAGPKEIQSLGLRFLDFKDKNWDDFLQSYQAKSREELKNLFAALMDHFADLLKKNLRQEARKQIPTGAWVDAIDFVMETKEAIDANANQKLALTRLAMRLMNVLPLTQVVSS